MRTRVPSRDRATAKFTGTFMTPVRNAIPPENTGRERHLLVQHEKDGGVDLAMSQHRSARS